ncbi:unnamed protein product [Arabidopsis halleri]
MFPNSSFRFYYYYYYYFFFELVMGFGPPFIYGILAIFPYPSKYSRRYVF